MMDHSDMSADQGQMAMPATDAMPSMDATPSMSSDGQMMDESAPMAPAQTPSMTDPAMTP
jgi:hypothetical protein